MLQLLVGRVQDGASGVLYTPRLFMPTTRFSTRSTTPTPCRPPMRFSSRIMRTPSMASPLSRTGTPRSNATSTYSAWSGAFSGGTQSLSMGPYLGSLAGFSRSSPSWDMCQILSSRL